MRNARPMGIAMATICGVALSGVPGCNSASKRTTLRPPPPASSDPIAAGATGTDVAVVDASPAGQDDGVIARHPLFRKPRDYYNSTNSNKAVKTAAAAVVGVPAGIIGEFRQIVVGRPASSSPTTY